MSKNKSWLIAIFLLLAVLIAACQPQVQEVQVPVEVTRVVVETVVEEGQQVEVTRVVTETIVETVTVEVPQEEAEMPESDKVLRVNLGTYPDIIDPQKSSFSNEIAHLTLIYEGLTKPNSALETVPGAAESWEYNEDATQLTFKLRDGLTYSDGSVLNAKRFEYAIQRNINPETAGEYAAITDEIIGAVQWRTSEDEAEIAAGADLVKQSVIALDANGEPCVDYEQTDCLWLQLTFTQPAPYFHTVSSLWVTFPAKEELLAEGGENWWNSSKYQIGNGPYVLQSLEPFVRGYFVPNQHYWEGVGNADIEFSYITDTGHQLPGISER
ncbi:MAG: hypothetical protein HC804_03540 [Anaerolineae bacterium]|nr:hypothetical protein [Anaerolineae bacterium]